MISKSSRFSSRLRTCMPVVPASPSIKTFFLAKSDDDDDDDDLIVFNGEKAEDWPTKRMRAADSFILLFLEKNFQVIIKEEANVIMCKVSLYDSDRCKCAFLCSVVPKIGQCE
jgi:hypothetical protein